MEKNTGNGICSAKYQPMKYHENICVFAKGKEKNLKITITKLPVELVDRGRIKPLYHMKGEDLGGDIESVVWDGLEAKEMIKSVKRILQDEY